MKPKNLICILVITGFFLIISNSVLGQSNKKSIDYSIKSESVNENGTRIYSLIVNIKSIEAKPYSVYLYDKEPWKGGNIIRKEEHSAKQKIVITGIEPMKYCVIVVDNSEVMNGKWYTVEP